VLRGIKICTHQTENPVRNICVRGPDFLSVDQPVIALVLAFRLERSEIRTGTGFRIALAPADFAARNSGQMLRLLFMCAVGQQRGAKHRDAEIVQRLACIDSLSLIIENLGLFGGKSRSSIFLGPAGYRIALGQSALEPYFLRLGLELPLAPAPALVFGGNIPIAHFFRAIFLQPCPDLSAKFCQFAHDLTSRDNHVICQPACCGHCAFS